MIVIRRPSSAALFLVALVAAMVAPSARTGGEEGETPLATGCAGAADSVLGLPPKNRGVRDILPSPAEREAARIALENGEGLPAPPGRRAKKGRRAAATPPPPDVSPFEEDRESGPPPPVRHDNPGPLRPFIVVHADPLMAQALVDLVDAHDYMAHEGAGPVWLYEELYRWHPRHAEALWNFTCGRTRGRWPACGSAVHGGPDPYDRLSVGEHERGVRRAMHHAAPRLHHGHAAAGDIAAPPRPLAVGFPVDLNLLHPAAEVEGAARGRPASKGLGVHPAHEPVDVALLEALLKRKARVVILASKSLTRRLLREASHGATPLRGGSGVPGRRSGVARALFGPAGYVNGVAPGAPRRADRHRHQLCGVPRAPELVADMLRHYSRERRALLALGDRLIQRYGLAVHILDADELLEDPRGGGLYSFYSYVLGAAEPSEIERHPFDGGGVDEKRHNHWAVPGALRARLDKYVRVRPAVLEDCADALERARVHVAVEEADDSHFLMADLDYVLAQIERRRQAASAKRAGGPRPLPAPAVPSPRSNHNKKL